MISRPQRPALGLLFLLAATALPMTAANAKKPTDNGSFNAAMIAGDPMSPVNPFNSGSDPLTMPGDARIGVFPYSRDQIFRVLTAPLKLTTIELEPGEKLIADPAMGDSIQWEVDDDKMNHVFIKPHKADIVNTLHLTTNRREYDFTLIASPAGGFFYQTVRFQYPRAPMARLNARDEGSGAGAGATGGERGGDSGAVSVAPDKLNWDYSVDGNAEFKPEVVFDDGHSIWMRMSAKAQTWPVPMYKDHGDRVVGNFTRRVAYLISSGDCPLIVVLKSPGGDSSPPGPQSVWAFLMERSMFKMIVGRFEIIATSGVRNGSVRVGKSDAQAYDVIDRRQTGNVTPEEVGWSLTTRGPIAFAIKVELKASLYCIKSTP